MLVELRVRDLAIAADVIVPLSPGLNVLTGSTGAGKSLVVEALRWLSGERVDRSRVRAGALRASAEALFDLSSRPDLQTLLEEVGVDVPHDGMLRVRREVLAAGRSRAFVGAQQTTASVLAALCGRLIELQSQHEQVTLLDPREHVHLLDRCGVAGSTLDAYREALRRRQQARRELQAWQERREHLRAQRELLEYQHRELEGARLEPGEMDALRQRAALQTGGAKLMGAVSAACQALQDEEHGALGALHRALHQLDLAGDTIDVVAEAGEGLRSAAALADDAARALESFLTEADFDPEEIERTQSRLAELEALCRKYARPEAALVELRDRLSKDLADLDLEGAAPAALRRAVDDATGDLEQAARALHAERKKVARRVQRESADGLRALGIDGGELRFEMELRRALEADVQVERTKVECAADGPADVELMVRTNPGEPLRRLARTASGGELSRIGFVLRTLAAAARQPALWILDEIDAGVGADLGPALAQRLRAMADRAQLLVISHLPAVAAAAAWHLAATKSAEDGRTLSRVEVLDREGRVRELMRMVGGQDEQHRKVAKALLDEHGLRAEASG